MTPDDPSYELIYWPQIPGRGEPVRLVLEELGVPYLDLARQPEAEGGGMSAIRAALEVAKGVPPFAPPVLRHGSLLIAQTAVICRYLAERHGLVPLDPGARLHADQLQLTLADLIAEIHDTHHPISVGLYYEQQREAAGARTAAFLADRLPKFMGYFERVIEQGEGELLLGATLTYPDLSLFHVLEGLDYAWPRAYAALAPRWPRLQRLGRAVRARPRIAAYLASERRLGFNEDGIFRHYPELDLPPSS